jgi:hypothetical protein
MWLPKILTLLAFARVKSAILSYFGQCAVTGNGEAVYLPVQRQGAVFSRSGAFAENPAFATLKLSACIIALSVFSAAFYCGAFPGVAPRKLLAPGGRAQSGFFTHVTLRTPPPPHLRGHFSPGRGQNHAD